MQKYISLLLFFSLILIGCTDNAVPSVGDFAFDLPEGYSITNIEDINCSIARDEDGAVIGGIILTQLTEKRMDEKIPVHLDSVTGTEVINEYFAWSAELDGSPVKLVTHYVTDPNTNVKKEFYRIFFVRNGGVYDMWFDTSLIDVDAIEKDFYPLF